MSDPMRQDGEEFSTPGRLHHQGQSTPLQAHVRDGHLLDRLPYDRQAEIEKLRADPAATQELARKPLRSSRGG